jgi:hypothetical protein
MFPFSVTGRVPLATQDDAQVLAAVQEMLDREGARVSTIDGDAVTFQNDLFRQGGRGSAIGPYDRGEIRIVRQGDQAWLAYDISLRRLLMIATSFAALVSSLQLLIGGTLLGVLMAFAFLWLWPFGMTYLTAAPRFAGWLSRAF